MSSIFLSHLVKPKLNPVETISGSELYLYIQVVSVEGSEKKAICVIEDEEKEFYNVRSLKEFRSVVHNILKRYKKFEFEILHIDHLYESSLALCIIENFINNEQDLQEKIDRWKLNKNLE